MHKKINRVTIVKESGGVPFMMKQKSKTSGRKALKILLVLLGLFVCFLALNIFYCSSEVVTTNYNITSEKLNGNLKIALLADLHLKD